MPGLLAAQLQQSSCSPGKLERTPAQRCCPPPPATCLVANDHEGCLGCGLPSCCGGRKAADRLACRLLQVEGRACARRMHGARQSRRRRRRRQGLQQACAAWQCASYTKPIDPHKRAVRLYSAATHLVAPGQAGAGPLRRPRRPQHCDGGPEHVVGARNGCTAQTVVGGSGQCKRGPMHGAPCPPRGRPWPPSRGSW